VKNNATQLFQTDLSLCNTDIDAVSETWLHKIYCDTYAAINGYTMFQFDIKRRRNGAVCFYVYT
jgi:hypothetical protein